MENLEIEKKIREVEMQSGFNLGIRLKKYKNSKVVKSILQNISENNKNSQWALGLIEGYKEERSKSNENRLNELDIIFDKKSKEPKTKGQER